jgi:hypothetical protein
MSRETFVDVCVLVENDYNADCRPPGYGMITAYQAIQEHGNIENLVFSKLVESVTPPVSKPTRKRKATSSDSSSSAAQQPNTTSVARKRAAGRKGSPVIPADFDYVAIRRIFLDVMRDNNTPPEILVGNTNSFDLSGIVHYVLSCQAIATQADLRWQLNRWIKLLQPKCTSAASACGLSQADLDELFPVGGYSSNPTVDDGSNPVTPTGSLSSTPSSSPSTASRFRHDPFGSATVTPQKGARASAEDSDSNTLDRNYGTVCHETLDVPIVISQTTTVSCTSKGTIMLDAPVAAGDAFSLF